MCLVGEKMGIKRAKSHFPEVKVLKLKNQEIASYMRKF